jgi:hypothetical protein
MREPQADGSIGETQLNECGDEGELPDESVDQCIIERVDDWSAGKGTPSEIDDMSPRCVDEGWNLEYRLVHRGGTAPAPGTTYAAFCELSENKVVDCPNLP